MKIIVSENFEEMSQMAAGILLGCFSQNRRVNVSVTAGNTPLRTYEILKERLANNNGFSNVQYYNFDELPILNSKNEVVAYETLDYLNKVYYGPCNIPQEQIYHLNEHNYQTFDSDIAQHGGLDLVVMGLGGDGHFCANMPETTSFNNATYNVTLVDDYPWNKPYQDSLGENHCDDMITMGPKTIMKARHLLLLVNGAGKADILKRCLEGKITEDMPASLLTLHNNLTIVCDKEAAAKLAEETLANNR